MIYLMWYDDNPKKTPAVKLADALAAYLRRFGHAATQALVNVKDTCAAPGVEVKVLERVEPNLFFVGEEKNNGT